MLYKLVIALAALQQKVVERAVAKELEKLHDAAQKIDDAEELGAARVKWAYDLYVKLHNRAVRIHREQLAACNAEKAAAADRITHLQSL
ncbi:hypothetical protein HOS47_gp15 [Pseudomonas phage uligo]|uniref:Uncharacterized protein n=1 Tax=Pseudomonas phage uligo TaxID=2048979 RepID=A0A2H4P7L1_9CAUD|nr:hypothetical protein HOS47_gp15 [Pseudomonas phage uligo]ATW58174.1 hypothetical protein [Pseudomonas phage uligo]